MSLVSLKKTNPRPNLLPRLAHLRALKYHEVKLFVIVQDANSPFPYPNIGVCGELTLKQRRAGGTSLGSASASCSHLDPRWLVAWPQLLFGG